MTESVTLSIPSRAWTRVICVFAPGVGRHRTDAIISSLREKLRASEERAERFLQQCTALEKTVERERRANATLRGQLRIANESNRKNEHPLHVPAPTELLEPTAEYRSESDNETTHRNIPKVEVTAGSTSPVGMLIPIPLHQKATP